MGNDLTYGQKVDMAVKWLILSRQLRCWDVFKWPMFGVVFLFAIWWIGGDKMPMLMLILSVLWILLSAYIAAHEAKKLILEKELRMQDVPRKKWFSLVGVEIVGEKTVKVSMMDLFGNQHTMYNSGYPSTFEWDILENMKSWVAQEERPKWGPAVDAINPNVIESQTKHSPWPKNDGRAQLAPDPQSVRCN